MVTWSHDDARRTIAELLAGDISLSTFRDVFAQLAWQFAEDIGQEQTASEYQQMVFDVDLALAEFSSGHRTEVELRAVLAPFAATYRALLGTGVVSREGRRGVAPTTTLIGAVAA